MKNILICGANGQLGNEFRQLKRTFKKYSFFFTDVEDLDITSEGDVNAYLEQNKIEALVNCAAYTAVDKAEDESDLANKLNGDAPGILARSCWRHNVLLFHISTDYVFNGHSFKPYTEKDTPNPMSAYGKSKLNGEAQIKKFANQAFILRTSWLYSSFGNNFVKTILKAAKERGELNVVFDQIGSPTYAADLAKAIMGIIEQKPDIHGVDILNFSNEGVISWYDFAVQLLAIKKIKCTVNPIGTAEYPTKAARPPYSVLDKKKIRGKYNIEVPYWRDSLKECLHKL